MSKTDIAVITNGAKNSSVVVSSPFSALNISSEQMAIIKTQIAPGISDNDLMYCLEIAGQAQLNPIVKDIYFVPRKANINGQWVEKHEPMIGRKGARAIARRKGMKVPPTTGHTIKLFPYMDEKGEWQEKRDLVGWAEMTIEGQKVRKEAAFSVYKQTKKDGTITQFWKNMPTVMVEKVAEFQLLDAVYGLDGIMSIDAGTLEDGTSSEEHTLTSFNKEIAQQIEQLGLKCSINDGMVELSGDVYSNAKLLKGLGFIVRNGKFTMPAAETDSAIDIDPEEADINQAKSNQPEEVENPAKELATFLAGVGYTKDEVSDFIRNHLGLTPENKDGILAVLADKKGLIEKAKEYFAKKQDTLPFDDGEELNF